MSELGKVGLVRYSPGDRKTSKPDQIDLMEEYGELSGDLERQKGERGKDNPES